MSRDQEGFERSRAAAYKLLGDALDELHGWNGLYPDQHALLVEARQHIAAAKDALNEAAS